MSSPLFPNGFLGTRADLLMDVILIAVLAVPPLLLYSFSKVQRQKHSTHARMQWGLFLTVLIAVILFETNIRLSGGSGALLKDSSLAQTGYFKILLFIHITVAVITYGTWGTWLLISGKKWNLKELPGGFSVNHRKVGKLIFTGACFTSISGLFVYIIGFAL